VDGEQILAELARRESGERIVIMSGSSGRVLDAAGASAAQRGLNIIGLLAKPFATAALRAMLSERAPAARELAPGLIQPVLKEPVLVQPVFSPASTPRLALR
jgi:hypothetical protein